MPPPNHHTGLAPSLLTRWKKRTFMCTVGTYGLRGCSTSETPIAWNERAREFGSAGGRRWRQVAARHVREIHAAALEYAAFLKQLRDASAAFGAHPFVAPKRLSVNLHKARDDRLLQPAQVLFDGVDVHDRRKLAQARRLFRILPEA